MIKIDGSQGEGGGQMLRTALSLSAISGIPVSWKNIRAGRNRPGLLQQHLCCVEAAASLCQADCLGAELGSSELSFIPNKIVIPDTPSTWNIGSAGSVSLVLQTIYPIIAYARQPYRAQLMGGTRVSNAPLVDFLESSFIPLADRALGLETELKVVQHGYFPRGGGKLLVSMTPNHIIRPVKAKIFSPLSVVVEYAISPPNIKSPWPITFKKNASLGKCVSLRILGEHGEISSMAFRTEEVPKVWKALIEDAQSSFRNQHIGEHLADQVMLPLLLAGGAVKIGPLSSHAKTNLELIHSFYPDRLYLENDSLIGSQPLLSCEKPIKTLTF